MSRLLRDKLAHLLAQRGPSWKSSHSRATDARRSITSKLSSPTSAFWMCTCPDCRASQAARHIGRRAHVVFVTAFDQYAVQAFAEGALDYLVKPVEPVRLADTVARLQERLRNAQPTLNTEALLQQLAAKLQHDVAPVPSALDSRTVGQSLRLIAVDEIDFLRSDEKYTLIAWRGDRANRRRP